MSINGKIKVIWKTKCGWNNQPHWFKRKEIKACDTDEGKNLLNPGDAVRVKFGSRWYNAEVCERWEPKQSKKAKKSTPNQSKAPEVPVADQQINAAETPTTSTPNAPVNDPYKAFVQQQKRREATWEVNRSAKKAKTADNGSTPRPTQNALPATETTRVIDPPTTIVCDEVDELRSELAEKNRTCDILSKKVEELKEASENAAKKQLLVTENIFKMVERIEDAIVTLESKMSAKLEKIEERLDHLEARSDSTDPAQVPCEIFGGDGIVSCSNTPSAVEMVNESIDLSTIDADALRSLQDVAASFSPIAPYASPQLPVPDADDSRGPVTDELIRSCVTPRKVTRVREVMRGEKVRYKCAVKLLPYFFSKEELATCNTEGTFEKAQLDRTRLHSLKVLLFTRFPVGPEEEETKSWKTVKAKINDKCRTTRFAYFRREGSENLRSN